MVKIINGEVLSDHDPRVTAHLLQLQYRLQQQQQFTEYQQQLVLAQQQQQQQHQHQQHQHHHQHFQPQLSPLPSPHPFLPTHSVAPVIPAALSPSSNPTPPPAPHLAYYQHLYSQFHERFPRFPQFYSTANVSASPLPPASSSPLPAVTSAFQTPSSPTLAPPPALSSTPVSAPALGSTAPTAPISDLSNSSSSVSVSVPSQLPHFRHESAFAVSSASTSSSSSFSPISSSSLVSSSPSVIPRTSAHYSRRPPSASQRYQLFGLPDIYVYEICVRPHIYLLAGLIVYLIGPQALIGVVASFFFYRWHLNKIQEEKLRWEREHLMGKTPSSLPPHSTLTASSAAVSSQLPSGSAVANSRISSPFLSAANRRRPQSTIHSLSDIPTQ